jgi:sulfatase maturation enzyme AslB (radical SAM superfamily)
MKAYIRSKINPELWITLSKLRRTPKLFIKDLAQNISLNIRFFIRKRKGFSSVTCLVPFMRLEFQDSGSVCPCCIDFTRIKSVGDMNYETIEEIWNGSEMQQFRKALLMGETKKTCMPNCEYLKLAPIPVEDFRRDTEEGQSLYDDVVRGRVQLRSHPLRFNLANSKICNLKCVMCRQDRITKRNGSFPEHVRRTDENIRNYFDKKITLFLCGNGDVFARKDTRELLQKFDSKKYSNVKFQILTNGLLFQESLWETIKHNNFTYVNISIDAGTSESYAKVRRGGNWNQLMKALDVFKKAKEEGKFDSVNLNMTVMRSNFMEIPQFIEMARSRGFHALLTRVRGKWGDENIFEAGNNGDIEDLKAVLSDGDLYGSDVDMNELIAYVPGEYRSKVGNHFTSIWYPSHILKPKK